MEDYKRLCGRVLISFFCVWHMAAVAVYALPWAAQDPFTQWLRTNVVPTFMPYVLWTSQWQQWNLFSPDPLRRVTTYVVSKEEAVGRFTPVDVIIPGRYSMFRHAAQFKLLAEVLESDPIRPAFVANFLQLECKELGLPRNTAVKITYRTFVIPKDRSIHSISWWREWYPTVMTTESPVTICNS